jgi:hypothetical protein
MNSGATATNSFVTVTTAQYHFFSRKRATYPSTREASDEECVKPNELFLADTTSYDISGLTDDQVTELVRKTLLR